jgi:hypothetical protein
MPLRAGNPAAEHRLRCHEEHSGLAEHKTEPNSGLGKAISYSLNHRPKPTLFLQQPGAPLDIAERAFKKAILKRKNSSTRP